MSVYADTGFLISLYLNETTTVAANRIFHSVALPVPLIALGVLELRNAFHLAVFRKQITTVVQRAAWLRVERDIQGGLYVVTPVPSTDLYRQAEALANRHSQALGTRSLDLLHLGAALILQAKEFLSFDVRQRAVAKAEGMVVRPA